MYIKIKSISSVVKAKIGFTSLTRFNKEFYQIDSNIKNELLCFDLLIFYCIYFYYHRHKTSTLISVNYIVSDFHLLTVKKLINFSFLYEFSNFCDGNILI